MVAITLLGVGGVQSTEYNPLALGNLALWLKGDAGVTPNGATASQWTDYSGYNRHFFSAVATNQPTIIPNGKNGLPTLRFDGVNDIMAPSSPIILTSITAYIVWKRRVVGSSMVLSAGCCIYPHWQRSTDVYIGGNNFPSTSMTADTWYLRASSGNSAGTVVKLFSNNVLNATKTGSNTYLEVHSLGDASYGLIDGELAEVLVFNEEHDTTKNNSVSNYLNGKWAIY